MRPAVFLDRDGVLNAPVMRDGVHASPRTAAEFVMLDGAVEAVRDLRAAGFVCIVVTNQPDIGRSLMAQSELDSMHRYLQSLAPVTAVYTCPHAGTEDCDCRKPRPGMLLRAAREHGLDLTASWTIGDRWVDVAAGAAAGTGQILVTHPFSFAATSSGTPPLELKPTACAGDIREAADIILGTKISAPRGVDLQND